jgi:hypothetical protein
MDWRRVVIFTHRWLGIGGCLLFLCWFVSGIVMMYARMPALTQAERLARQPPLDTTRVAVTPADAAARHGLTPQRVKVAMLGGRPAYRFLARGRWTAVFADTGERFDAFTKDQALAETARFAREHAATLRYDAHLIEPDQWTLESRALLPMHRVALGDADGTVVYVSDVSGEVAVKTTARERRIAYAGAILHWLYFTPFRKHGPLWTQSIIWLSVAGSVMCLLGLVWGVYSGIRSPYRGWMRWHHYAGLAFGVVSFTWIFSGLLSMDPWDWHPSTAPTRAQAEAFSGGPLRLDRFPIDALDRPTAAGRRRLLKEIELTQFRGEPRVIDDNRPGAPIDQALLVETAKAAMPGVGVADAVRLDAYDAYFYDRHDELPLPVLRVRFTDPQRTWFYIDPNRGVILRKEERLSRLNRWLYHGLHSLDFPWLYNRRPLWDIVVILLSLGGMASAVTSLAPAWRRLRRHAQHLYT